MNLQSNNFTENIITKRFIWSCSKGIFAVKVPTDKKFTCCVQGLHYDIEIPDSYI